MGRRPVPTVRNVVKAIQRIPGKHTLDDECNGDSVPVVSTDIRVNWVNKRENLRRELTENTSRFLNKGGGRKLTVIIDLKQVDKGRTSLRRTFIPSLV